MAAIKAATAKVKNNAIGAIAGAGLTFYFGRKRISNKWMLVGACILGAVVGAYGQSMIKARTSSPTKETVKK